MGISPHWFSSRELVEVSRASEREWESPIPTQVVSNGEYMPPAQTGQQREVEARIREKSDRMAKKLGVTRRDFLRTASGMAAAFLAMNEVYGGLFRVDPAEATDLDLAAERHAALKGRFVFDGQTHHVAEDYKIEGLLALRRRAAGENSFKAVLNSKLLGEKTTLEKFKFENYVKDIFLDSDTTVALLSSFTSDDPERIPLTNTEMVATRDTINRLSGTRRLLAHGLAWPGFPGNLEQMEHAARTLRVDSWKSYTVGDPGAHSVHPFRLDDEKVTYPSYELALKLGIRNWCTHKGLLPQDYKAFKNWEYADVSDLGKAAQDWPGINFVIYHAALRPGFDNGEIGRLFEEKGEIPWVDDLAAIPAKFGVGNVYADLGSTFASVVITQPRLCAALMGKLIAGCGVERVLWGTDSVWYGSPQWQIDALRRLTIPDDVARKAGLSKSDQADFNAGPTGRIKSAILGHNSAALYGFGKTAAGDPLDSYDRDGLAQFKAEYLGTGARRDNRFHGWIRRHEAILS